MGRGLRVRTRPKSVVFGGRQPDDHVALALAGTGSMTLSLSTQRATSMSQGP
jgi:hypothetical protein